MVDQGLRGFIANLRRARRMRCLWAFLLPFSVMPPRGLRFLTSWMWPARAVSSILNGPTPFMRFLHKILRYLGSLLPIEWPPIGLRDETRMMVLRSLG